MSRTPDNLSASSRHDRRRILAMVTLLVLVIVAISVTRRAENWNWFFLMTRAPDEASLSPAADSRSAISPTPLDTPSPIADKPPSVSSAPVDPVGAAIPIATPDIARLPRETLAAINDQQLGRVAAEDESLRTALRQVSSFSQSELLAAGRRDVGYRIMNELPETARGDLVFLEGTLWRLGPYAFQDESGKSWPLTQAWILTPDAGANPCLVLLAEPPENVSPGDALDLPVKTAGYFFKRYGYPTEHGLHVAPLLVARTLTVSPPPTLAAVAGKRGTSFIVWASAALALLFVVIRVSLLFRRRPPLPLHRRRELPSDPELFADVAAMETESTLQQLAQQHQEETPKPEETPKQEAD